MYAADKLDKACSLFQVELTKPCWKFWIEQVTFVEGHMSDWRKLSTFTEKEEETKKYNTCVI